MTVSAGLKQVLVTTVLFAFFGPLIGGLVISPIMLVSDARDTLGSLVVSFFLYECLAFLFGVIPATVAGILAGVARSRLAGRRFVIASAMIGFAVAMVYGTVMDGDIGRPTANEVGALLLLCGLPGLVGGAGASALQWWFTRPARRAA